jgi:hypothetical protein
MKKIGIVAVLTVLAAGPWAAGCGSSTSACDLQVLGVHECYTTNEPGFMMACTETPGGSSSETCPTTNAVGTCAVTVGGYTETYTFYTDAGPTKAEAEKNAAKACDVLGGIFIP